MSGMSLQDVEPIDQDALRKQAQDAVRDLRARTGGLAGGLDQDAIDLVLRGARSHYAWTDQKVSEAQLREIYNILKMGPTSMNTCPMRVVFVTSPSGKDRLAKALKPANIPKVTKAPVTAIVAYDLDFWTHLPKLFPHEDRRHFFEGKAAHIEDTAFRNSTLQGAYLMIAARAMGLDVGPISGFSNEIVDQEFFADTTLKSNFLCNIGYADETALFQKLPRFDFEEVCSFV